MDLRYDIPAIEDAEEKLINVVVEIPIGTNNKYEIDEKTGRYVTVVRTLENSFLHRYKYPFNYGFIPSTLAPDGDQLDAIIIADEPIAPMTIIKCKVVGAISTIDKGEQDDKIIVVPVYSTKKSANLSKIVKFLKKYKYPEQDSTQISDDILGKDEAFQLIEDNIQNYVETKNPITKVLSEG